MKKIVSLIIVLILLVSATPVLADVDDSACWGQASVVYAQMGVMGEHSSQESTPRIGLRNLARYLYDIDEIAEPTMEALGQYVASAEGLSIDACME